MGFTQVQDDRSAAIFSYLLEVTEAANTVADAIKKKRRRRPHEKAKEDVFYNLTRGFVFQDSRYSMVLIHGRTNKIPGFVARVTNEGIMEVAWLDHYTHHITEVDISQLWYERADSLDAMSEAFTSWFLETTPLPQISRQVFPRLDLRPSTSLLAGVTV